MMYRLLIIFMGFFSSMLLSMPVEFLEMPLDIMRQIIQFVPCNNKEESIYRIHKMREVCKAFRVLIDYDQPLNTLLIAQLRVLPSNFLEITKSKIEKLEQMRKYECSRIEYGSYSDFPELKIIDCSIAFINKKLEEFNREFEKCKDYVDELAYLDLGTEASGKLFNKSLANKCITKEQQAIRLAGFIEMNLAKIEIVEIGNRNLGLKKCKHLISIINYRNGLGHIWDYRCAHCKLANKVFRK